MLLNYIVAFLLFTLGLYVILVKKNIVKIVIGLGLMDSGINLLIISVGCRLNEASSTLMPNFKEGLLFIDPIPQALVLTSILISTCVTALALAFVVKIKEHYGTLDADKVRRLNG